METIIRHFRFPSGSSFLFGPRGTGKSTLLRQRFKNSLYIDLLDPERVLSLSADPSRLRGLVAGQPGAEAIVLDEVQKVPGLLPVVHGLIEEKSHPPFVMTGSSARKLKRTGADLLAGRAVLKNLHPFMASELQQRFRLDDALRLGMLPIVLSADRPSEVLRTYAALYVKEEVMAEGLVRSMGTFSRFLEAISFSHAGVLSISNVARECAVERKTVEGYLSVLEDLLLAWRLPVFTRRARRELVAHPKFYFFDSGVFRSLRPSGPLDRAEEMQGQALEGLVAQHLRAWLAYGDADGSLSYWRTRAGTEVDFVLYGSFGLFAIEVKNSARIHPQNLRPLKSFRAEYPESQACLLYRGRDRLLLDGIPCLPVEEFLLGLHPDRPPLPAAQ